MLENAANEMLRQTGAKAGALMVKESIKWGLKPPTSYAGNEGRKGFNMPLYARYRMKVQYNAASAYYYSYDYTPKFNNGVKIGKQKSELIALNKLIELMNKKSPDAYRYAVIYCNVSNDLSTKAGRYDLHICNILRSGIVWKNVPVYQTANNQMLNLNAMREMLTLQKKQNEY